MKRKKRFAQSMWSLTGALLLALPLSSAAETLMMPDREGLVGEDVVVWGATDQVGNYTLDCDNGTTDIAAVGDGSYIPFVCNYASEGTFTASLTVGGESDTADVRVFDAAGLSAFDERGIRINMAIEDGLRWLWVNQVNRAANFPAGTTTEWAGGFWVNPYTSFVVLGFENQGYRLTNDNVAPTDIYEKYVVRRGINRILTNLSQITLGPQAAGDPCVGLPIDGDECTGLYENRHNEGHKSYSTGVATLALAGSGALARTNTEVAGYINGKSYGEILQRMANALVFGQIEAGASAGDRARGGWYYDFNSFSSDGSVVGWVLLGLLDAEAAGATVPAFAKSEHAFAVNGSLNNDGSYDYQSDGNPASPSSAGIEKGGVGLQGLFYSGELAGPRVAAVEQYLSDRWNGGPNTAFSTNWGCGPTAFVAPFDNNHGCAYSMYNAFKGLKLIGTQTLPGVGRPAGPGPTIVADDWHEDYKDWLVANQTNPTTTTGGNWGTMQFSRIDNSQTANAAIAELILSPVALIFPDPVKFATIGLQPFTAENFVDETHTVTAHAEGACTPPPDPCTGPPVPGATVNFEVLSGPNMGATGSDVTDANGDATFTYDNPTMTPGTDTIQASIGSLDSNIVEKVWILRNEAPDCSNAAADPDELWPPNHKFNAISVVGVTDPDGDAVMITIDSIFQDEPTDTFGDGNFTPDGQGVGTATAEVRAERSGTKEVPGDGRVYHIGFTADDGQGAECSENVTVCVPHDQGNGSVCVDGGALFDSTLL